MPELINDPISTNQRLDLLGLDSITPTTSEVLGATWDETIIRNPTPSLWRQFRRGQYQDGTTIGPNGEEQYVPAVPSKILSTDEANERFGIKDGAGKALLKFDADTPEPIAEELYKLKRDELARKDVMRRAQGGFGQGAAQFGVGLVASVLDPVNIASAFIPVVGEARYATMLAGAAGAGERALIRAGVGALEGGVGAAVVEPIVYGVAKSEQADYDMTDSMMNLAFGTVLGGGLHTSIGAVGDKITGRFARQIEAAPLEVKETALRSAVAAVAEGRPVRIDPLFRTDLMNTTSLTDVRASTAWRWQDPMNPRAEAGGLAEPGPPPGAPADRVLVPGPGQIRDGAVKTFASFEDAQRAADRSEARFGVALEPHQVGDEFVLRQAIDAQPLRNPDGTPMVFKTERAAERYLKQQGDDATVVPIRTPEGQRYTALRGASPDQVEAIRARPEAVEYGRGQDEGVAASNRGAAADAVRQQTEARESLRRMIADSVGAHHWIDDADMAAIRAVDERVNTPALANLSEAETALADVLGMIDNLNKTGHVTPEEIAHIAEVDALVKHAGETGKAADVAAMCMLRTA